MWAKNEWDRGEMLDLGRFTAQVSKKAARDRPRGEPMWFWQASRVTHSPFTVSALNTSNVMDSQGYCRTEAAAKNAAENRLRRAGAKF